MANISILETKYERFLRTRAEEICQSYLSWSHEIMSGEVKPNRVIQRLAVEKGMSGEGVKNILKRRGLYISSRQPVVVPHSEARQLSMSFPSDSDAKAMRV